MKTIILLLLCLVAAPALAATNLLSLTYVNGTNNGNPYYVSNIVIPKQRYVLQSLGITNAASGNYTTNGITNSIRVNFQISVDGSNTNWVTLYTYKPPTTNANVDSTLIQFEDVSLPIRAQVITTNALGVSVFVQ